MPHDEDLDEIEDFDPEEPSEDVEPVEEVEEEDLLQDDEYELVFDDRPDEPFGED
jgi:hypothetical protein